MSDKISYPILEWKDSQYWGKIIAFLLFIIVIGIISYSIAPEYNFWATISAYVQILILYAIHERQKLLLLYINSIVAISEERLRPPDGDVLSHGDLPSWTLYESRLKKLIRWFSTALLLYSLPIFLFVGNKNLAFKIGFAPSIVLVYFWHYVKSIYLMEFLHEAIDANMGHRQGLSKYMNLFEMSWKVFKRKLILDGIIVSTIILIAIVLYLMGVTDLFRGIVLFWAAFLYPGLRETIDVNLLLNKFSSAARNQTALSDEDRNVN